MVPARSGPVAAVSVLTEEPAERGWRYRVSVERDGAVTEHDVSLAWVDHDFWSGGVRPPSRVAAAVVEALLAEDPRRVLPARFDASTARRWCPGLDSLVQRRL